MTDLREFVEYLPDTGEFKYLYKSSNQAIGHITRGTEHGGGYLVVSVKGKRYKAHRLAFYLVHGRWPEQIDHINGIKDDNRLSNLREVDNQLNQWNTDKRNPKSGYKNVYWRAQRNKWQVKISTENGLLYVGSFSCKEEANLAAIEARIRYQKEHSVDVR